MIPINRARRLALLSLLGFLLVPAALRAEPRADARRHFRKGMELVGAGRYDEGIAELRAAYLIKPHPNVLFNIAKAQLDAGKVNDAIATYQHYLASDPADAEAVKVKVATLQASLAPKEEAKQKPAAPAQLDAQTADRLQALVAKLDSALGRVEALERSRSAPAAATEPAVAAPAASSTDSGDEIAEGKGDAYEEVVVTASRYAQNARLAPASTTTITDEEIRLSGARSVAELLRRVPGIDVMQLGVSSTNVSARGFNQRLANKMLVLVDGRSVYEDFLGFTLFDELPIALEEIDHIEVIRGPGSALYGANAFMGVVNILTRRPGTGPANQLFASGGNGNAGAARYVSSQRVGRLALRTSAGYEQANKFSVDFGPERTDLVSTLPDAELGLRSIKANGVVTYALAPGVKLGGSAGVNKIFTELYPSGLLRNYWLDGLHTYTKADLSTGPVKLRVFWNHLQAAAAPQYTAVGSRELSTTVVTNVVDGDAQIDLPFKLAGDHRLTVGTGYRLKGTNFGYLDAPHVEHHYSAFAQEEYHPIQALTLLASLRADRHPLLDDGAPGFAISPHGAAVFEVVSGHAVFFSAGTAFRVPSFVESYLSLFSPVPSLPSASVLTVGNPGLRPERMFSLELGYRGEITGLGWDVALYRNQVRDLVVLSPIAPLPAGKDFDSRTDTYLLGRSSFINDERSFTAIGGELGLRASPADRVSLRGALALQRITPDSGSEACGPCTETPRLKLSLGGSYRTPYKIDLNVDAAYVGATTWIEREPSRADLTQIEFKPNRLKAYTVVSARLAYRFFDEKMEAALVGSQLAGGHKEHPFGNLIDTRVMLTLGAQL